MQPPITLVSEAKTVRLCLQMCKYALRPLKTPRLVRNALGLLTTSPAWRVLRMSCYYKALLNKKKLSDRFIPDITSCWIFSPWIYETIFIPKNRHNDGLYLSESLLAQAERRAKQGEVKTEPFFGNCWSCRATKFKDFFVSLWIDTTTKQREVTALSWHQTYNNRHVTNWILPTIPLTWHESKSRWTNFSKLTSSKGIQSSGTCSLHFHAHSKAARSCQPIRQKQF